MRVKRGFKARKRRAKILQRAKGFYGANSRCYSIAKERSDRALAYEYRDRRTKKRDFRRLWIQRVSAAVRLHGSSYSVFMGALQKKGVPLNRKILADLAVRSPESFAALVKQTLH